MKHTQTQEESDKAHLLHIKLAGLGKYTDLPDHPPIIKAKDTIIGKDYLVVGLYYKVTIKRVNKIDGMGVIASISMRSEKEPSNEAATMSADTDLIEYSDAWHYYKVVKKEKKTGEESVVTKVLREKKEKVMKEKKPSLSSFIDPFVFKMSLTEKPDFKLAAKEVIKSGVLGADTTEKQILSLMHVRYWHYKNGKISPDKKKEVK